MVGRPKLRYVEWRDTRTGAVTARELYDHEQDPLETVNVAHDPRRVADVESLARRTLELAASSGRWPGVVAPRTP